MKLYLILILMILPLFAIGKATEELVKSMVPQGKIISMKKNDFIVKTPAGTQIELEFERDGSLDEASGENLTKGDLLEPGQGLINLGSAVQTVELQGHKVAGEWSLEKDSKLGWIYEFEGVRGNQEMEYTVDAKKGQLLKMEE